MQFELFKNILNQVLHHPLFLFATTYSCVAISELIISYYSLRRLINLKVDEDNIIGDNHSPLIPNLAVRILNLDDSLSSQEFLAQHNPNTIDLRDQGPKIRMGCSFRTFKNFEKKLSHKLGSPVDNIKATMDKEIQDLKTQITFFGSNDFHHVSLILVRRIREQFNITIFDNHPDWFTLNPGLHCGTWLNHCLELPTVESVFHFGGYSSEFEDYQLGSQIWTPWNHLESQKLIAFPAIEEWTEGNWTSKKIKQHVMRKKISKDEYQILGKDRGYELLEEFKQRISSTPMYVTFDKDVMMQVDSLQNWNSGVLIREEVFAIIEIFFEWTHVIAIDVTGEFSPVNVTGKLQTWLHENQHCEEQNNIDPRRANLINGRTNRELMNQIALWMNK